MNYCSTISNIVYFVLFIFVEMKIIKFYRQQFRHNYYMHLISYLVRLNGSIFHIEVPDFDRQVVSGHHVAAVVTELDI